MAKESVKARERKREATVAKYAVKRAALKAAGDYVGLDKLPKNASPAAFKAARLTAYFATVASRFLSLAFTDSLAIL